MTVGSDIDKVARVLRAKLGGPNAADDWLDEPRECWDGKCAIELIESGRTDEVLEVVEEGALR